MAFLKIVIAIAAVAILAKSDAQAEGLQWTGGVKTGIEYLTDNTSVGGLDTSSTESRATVTPAIGVSASGRRTAFSLNASLVAKASSESEESDISPRLTAKSSVFTTNKRLQFDSVASVQQRTVNSPFLENDTLFDTNSTERVVSIFAGPRYEKSFDNTLFGASYRVGTTSSSAPDDLRTVTQAAVVQVIQLLPNTRWLAGSRINVQHTAVDSAPSALSQIFRVFTGYQFRNNLAGQVALGRDVIDVDNAITDTDNHFWAVGVNWRIGRRVVVDASYAERTFGRQPIVSIGINGRRSSVELSWTRNLGISAVADNIVFDSGNLSDEGGLYTGDEEIQTTSSEGTDSSADTSELLFLPLFQESQNINENLTLSYSLRGRVSVFRTSVSRVEQENLVNNERSTSMLLDVSLSRQITKASGVTVKAAVGESEQFGGSIDFRTKESSSRVGVTWSVGF